MKICSLNDQCARKCYHKQPHHKRGDCSAACGANDEIARCFTYDAFGEVDVNINTDMHVQTQTCTNN